MRKCDGISIRWLGQALVIVAVGADCLQQAYVGNDGDAFPGDALMGAVATASLLARWKWPWLTSVVVLVAGVWSGMALPLLVMVFHLSVTGMTGWAVALGASSLIGAGFTDRSPNLWDARALGPIALLSCAVVLGLWVAQRRENVDAMRRQVEHVRAERELRVDSARLAERSQIAAEMHDVLGHRLSLIALHTGVLGTRSAQLPETVADRVALLRQTSTDALAELRQILGVLRDQQSGRIAVGTADDIADIVEQARSAGQDIETEVVGDSTGLSSAQHLAAIRVVQEGLTNARTHAPGQPVVLTLAYRPSAVTIEITNATAHHSPISIVSSGFGLVGLAERAEALGGHVTAGPDGHLWILTATIPSADQGDAEC